MKIRTSVLLYGLSLVVVSPALAQNNNNRGYHGYSDKGGPNVNGSDRQGPKENKAERSDDENSAALRAKTGEVSEALATGSLALPNGESIPASAQAKLYAVLTTIDTTTGPAPPLLADSGGTVPYGLASNRARLSAPFATAGQGARAALPPLMRSLSGLAFYSAQLPTAIGDYNNFVQAASPSFLANPPPEFLAVHRVLAILTAAAGWK